MSEANQEVPVPGKTRCVNDKGQVSYVNDATAQNKHWQRSTGYKPKPLPVVENLPPLTEPKAEVEETESKPRKGRPSKTTETN